MGCLSFVHCSNSEALLNRGCTWSQHLSRCLPPLSQVLIRFVSDPEDVTDPNDAEDTDCDGGDTSQTVHTEDERTACYCTLVARKVLWELGETSESEYFPTPMVFCSVELGLGNPCFFPVKLHSWQLLLNR